jgi:hypothetical protein
LRREWDDGVLDCGIMGAGVRLGIVDVFEGGTVSGPLGYYFI